MDLIIKGGMVVTATETYRADVGVRDGRIAQIGGDFVGGTARRVIDASGKLVIPGGIDVHTHFDAFVMGTTTADDYQSGTLAAVCGGTTTIVNFLLQEKGERFHDLIARCHTKAEGRAAADYGFHTIVADMSDASLRQLATLPKGGVTSFKVFMAYKGTLMMDDATMLKVLEIAKHHGALVMVHAENGDAASYLQQKLLSEGKIAPKYHAPSRPPRIEAEATARAIMLAETVGAPVYFVHMSCAEAIEELERGRARGVQAFGETCSHYLHFSEDVLDRPGFEGAKYVYTPPARPKHHLPVLWRALGTGDLQVVSSDHCAFNFHGQKDLGRDDFTKIPNGAPGVEERLIAVFQGVHTGRLTPNQFVDLVATKPAKLFGLYPKKGTIAVGSDADLVIWDPDAEVTLTSAALHHRVDYSLYEGMSMRGVPQIVTLRGEVVVEDRKYVGRAVFGRFVERTPVQFSSP